MLTKKAKIGRKLEDISIGEKLIVTEHIEEKHIYLYLALTGDTNPLYTQYNYASQTKYKKPIVPSIIISGLVAAAVTKHLPGPGSHIVKKEIQFDQHIHHNETISIHFEVADINVEKNEVSINVSVLNKSQKVIASGNLIVIPPKVNESNALLYENF
ncbi:MaoC/PaaZ C-terminal domain-containing protein [Gottfriedia luciferensis]|uniref:MaoC/PaaZ C-terminal domain-containing protein n=1 Tax=Gottfriedia luciferensis TaxID=178774 RepID=UPI000B44924B|nr:MaoC/PaaZ C-terminal domain-containing protein [Gottfriedia luciferensis]